jgi:hypothetical protein
MGTSSVIQNSCPIIAKPLLWQSHTTLFNSELIEPFYTQGNFNSFLRFVIPFAVLFPLEGNYCEKKTVMLVG